jgi:hypothetical protein
MNQSIQFNDGVVWQEAQQRLMFSAQMLGATVPCYISRHYLEQLVARPLVRPDELLQTFEALRFDIEELAEQRIAEQEFAEDGSIYLY